MCVLAFAWQAHPRWQLVVAGNRDELHARPAAALAHWEQPGDVLAGRDLQSGGTWLGVSEQGRFVVITNLRGFGAPAADRVSRGRLVTELLAGDGDYGDPDQASLSDFNPFNLIIADRAQARFLTNRPEAARSLLDHGLYGLSNGRLDEPWPKTMQIKGRLLDWIVQDAEHPEALLDDLRIDTMPKAGFGSPAPSDVPLEPDQSPIFIRNPVYGTRCSTVVAIDVAGQGTIIERRFDPAGAATGDTRLSFSWPG